jgi:hypothetical protein
MRDDGIIDGPAGNDGRAAGTLFSDQKLIALGIKVRIIWRTIVVGRAMYGTVGELQ